MATEYASSGDQASRFDATGQAHDVAHSADESVFWRDIQPYEQEPIDDLRVFAGSVPIQRINQELGTTETTRVNIRMLFGPNINPPVPELGTQGPRYGDKVPDALTALFFESVDAIADGMVREWTSTDSADRVNSDGELLLKLIAERARENPSSYITVIAAHGDAPQRSSHHILTNEGWAPTLGVIDSIIEADKAAGYPSTPLVVVASCNLQGAHIRHQAVPVIYLTGIANPTGNRTGDIELSLPQP